MENKPNLTFEDAMKRLEEIVRQLEAGELPLSESLEKYQESMQLVKFCREQLDKAELQLEQLSFDDGDEIAEKSVVGEVSDAE
ncbi:exodeoxyribonuclease VII small subunit [Alicyclobacillus dauci]|uniref:Exodeoxyribonuclease 7 small subunit n=1 Tax=Alicyclobacillus dauci TaxID=1475485 RepID=A0ABY6Z7Z5_9BACL|nr:exodeoxyribonuclease VII small subunit [Alicyclobacillus dauci]WAH39012.1 exodeoxyribonuclease VII small subunit [Alicyclobacillus dauci]